MNYSNDIILTAMLSGIAWEAANQVDYTAVKVLLRGASFVFGAITIGFIVLQYIALSGQ